MTPRIRTRHGTTSPVAALDIKTGVVIGPCPRHQEVIKPLNSADAVARETSESGTQGAHRDA